MLALLFVVVTARSVVAEPQLPILLEKEAESISLPPPPKSAEEMRSRQLDDLVKRIGPAFEYIKHTESERRMQKRIKRQVVTSLKEMGVDETLVENIHLMLQAQKKLANARRMLERIRKMRV